MAEAFDAYHRWLGIPPKDQPPNYYRLLGLGKFESDPEVIAAAADRAAKYVGSCAQPPYDKLAQKLIERIGRAKTTLLDSTLRSAYDAKLRAAVVGTLSSSTGVPRKPSAPAPLSAHQTPAAQPMPPVGQTPAGNAKPPASAAMHPAPQHVEPVSKTTLQHLRHAKPIAQAVSPTAVVQPVAKVQLVHPVATAPAANLPTVPDEPLFAVDDMLVTPSSSAGRKSTKGRKKQPDKPNLALLGGGAVVLILLAGASVFLLMRGKPGETAKTAARKAGVDDKQLSAEQSVDLAGDASQSQTGANALAPSEPAAEAAHATTSKGASAATAPVALRTRAAASVPGETPELIALVTGGGSVSRLEQLISGGVHLEDKDNQGRTALRIAVLADRLDLVAALLAAKAKPNTVDESGETPLMSAAQTGNLQIVEALLAAGAEPGVKTPRTGPDTPAGLTALLVAARHGRTEVVKALLAKGAAVDSANQDGVTPLMAAAVGGNLATVELLLTEKASVSITDKRGQTALMFATHGGNLDVVNTLLKHGAMANVRTPEQVSALSIALDAKNAKLANVLREAIQKEGPVVDF